LRNQIVIHQGAARCPGSVPVRAWVARRKSPLNGAPGSVAFGPPWPTPSRQSIPCRPTADREPLRLGRLHSPGSARRVPSVSIERPTTALSRSPTGHHRPSAGTGVGDRDPAATSSEAADGSRRPSRRTWAFGLSTATVETWGPDNTPIGTGRDEPGPPTCDFFPKNWKVFQTNRGIQ
jgi:hypothetical protein